ncbi:hypothetical protein [Spirosoma pollinicola]|uniref:Uncharacterized protein n=1 Tax=Spirosoma pollinicola TaxID=2057025 RepID=A0A2K8Z2Y0_9BACT|nr:hypothetical protein [Spirosoma pollinicola]AUD04184.1 hypothetical protein CWM47_21500 [Spirosoma pollinicola]
MQPLFSAWLIDPYLESVYPIELTDSLSDISRWVGTVEIGFFLHQPSGDRAIMNGDVLTQPPLPPGWQWRETGAVYYGRALWIHVNKTGELMSPELTRYWLVGQLEFIGFRELAEYDTELSDDDDEDWNQFLDEQD